MTTPYLPVATTPSRCLFSSRPLTDRGSGSDPGLDEPIDFSDFNEFDEVCPEPLNQLVVGAEARVIDRYLVCGHGILDLRGCAKTLRLFQAFCTAPNQRRNRAHLLQQVYDIEMLENRSARYVKSNIRRVNKIVSRARKKLKQAFAGTQYEWLAYDRTKKEWILGRAKLPVRYLS